MRQKSKTILNTVYTALLCLSIAAAGICLMAQCLLLYRSGDHPFSREAVAAAFSQIALPVYLCGGLVLIGLLIKPWLSCPEKQRKPEKNYGLILHRLQSTTDLALCPEKLRKEAEALRARRVLVRNLGWAVLCVSSFIFLSYGANPSNYHSSQINTSMVGAMLWLVPTMLAPFAYSVFAAYHRQRSIKKEIDLLKAAPREAKCSAAPKAAVSDQSVWIRWGILAAAVVLIVYGWLIGGAVDVLTKAVNICTECIGLG